MSDAQVRSRGASGVRVVALVGLAAGAILAARAAAAPLPLLEVSGRYLVDESGAKVTLRGCNLGNWLQIEPWMLAMTGERYRDQHGFVTTLESRFGAERTQRLLDVYRANWITARELRFVKSFGFNLVRVPFHHTLLASDERPLDLRDNAFEWLDRAVDLAEQAGAYVILDLHGVPGGQSIDASTGRAGENKLWDDPASQQRTLWLWQRIAEHYRGRSAIVAYDVINEPWGDFHTDVRPKLVPLMERIYAALREVDPDKLVFAPGSLRGISFYGAPREHGWKNVGFTEHFYPGLFGQGAPALETHARFLAFPVAARRRMIEQLDVPYLMGEFNVVFDAVAQPDLMRRYFDEFGASGWLATMWSLRMVSPQGGVRPDHWYLLTNAEPFTLPDLQTASYEEIENAFRRLGSMDLVADEGLRAALTASEGSRLPLASFPPAAPRAAATESLPGWTGVDVSATPAGGAEPRADGGMTVYGGGSDLWGNCDEFHFVYREAAGDFNAQNWLTSFEVPHHFAKAGWMLRESVAPDAAHVLVHALPDGRVMLAWRAQRGGLTHEQTLAISGLPVGLGLEREGETVYVRYTDGDGQWRRQSAPPEVRLGEKALLGLVVLSHDETALASATFSGLDRPDAAPSREADGANLLSNASFEVVADAADAVDRAQHWDRWGHWFNRERDWKPQRDGRCVLGYHHWQIESADNSGVYQDVTGLTPGTRCAFSIYASRDVPADGKHGPESVEVRLESRREGRLLTVASQTYQAKDIATGDGWSLLQVTGTIPADNARVLVIANPSRESPRDAALKFDVAALRVQQRSDTHVTVSIPSKSQPQEKKEERHE